MLSKTHESNEANIEPGVICAIEGTQSTCADALQGV